MDNGHFFESFNFLTKIDLNKNKNLSLKSLVRHSTKVDISMKQEFQVKQISLSAVSTGTHLPPESASAKGTLPTYVSSNSYFDTITLCQ